MDGRQKLTPLHDLNIKSDGTGWQVGDEYVAVDTAFEWDIPIDEFKVLPEVTRAKMIAYVNAKNKMKRYEEQLQSEKLEAKDNKVRFTPGKSFKRR